MLLFLSRVSPYQKLTLDLTALVYIRNTFITISLLLSKLQVGQPLSFSVAYVNNNVHCGYCSSRLQQATPSPVLLRWIKRNSKRVTLEEHAAEPLTDAQETTC